MTDYYDTVHTLCKAQQNFAKSTQVLEKKIEDKSVFLDIIKQVQLPSVQVQVRTVEKMEKMEGKTYRELTLMCHLPNFKRINPNTKEQTRTMAMYIYFILYEQITSMRASQTGCTTDFRCQTTPFKRLITGKKQPGRPGRLSEAKWKAQPPPREQGKGSQQQQQHPHPKAEAQKAKAKRVRRLSKPSEQIGRTVRLDVGLGGVSKILNTVRQDQVWRAEDSSLYIVYIRSVLFQKFPFVQ